jgi:hypothetical protein
LRLLLHALSFSDSWQAAAAAFRALTMRCATRLANVPVLQSLAAAATAAIAPQPQAGQVGRAAGTALCCVLCRLAGSMHVHVSRVCAQASAQHNWAIAAAELTTFLAGCNLRLDCVGCAFCRSPA